MTGPVRGDDATPVAIVTGGSRGIGAAVATRLGAEGYHVVLTYLGAADRAEKVAAGVVEAGGAATVERVDVGVETDVKTLFRGVKRAHGRLDVLVNNAGITQDGFTAMMSAASWSKVIDTDLTGTFFCVREASKLMLAQRFGSIVNVASIAGLVGTAGQPNYSAAKAGVIGLTKSLADELGPRGIRVNAVVPGFVDTDMLSTMPAGVLTDALSRVPLGRAGTPLEVAEAVAWLAGRCASYVTGAALVVDGGLTRH